LSERDVQPTPATVKLLVGTIVAAPAFVVYWEFILKSVADRGKGFKWRADTFIARKWLRHGLSFSLSNYMSLQPQLTHDPAEWLGDAHPLLEQLGSADGLASLSGLADALRACPVASLAALREFLHAYHERILLPHELPAIQTAFAHACRNEVREIIAFDQQLVHEPMLQDLAGASRRVGQAQLQKLRPLRDERGVQRYLAAVENHEAHGWHTLVYGLSLAVYSLPLRPGLLGYAHQTTRGFIQAAARSLHFMEADCRALFDELCAPLPAAVESIVGKSVAA
jgi:urease accessory protein UreF